MSSTEAPKAGNAVESPEPCARDGPRPSHADLCFAKGALIELCSTEVPKKGGAIETPEPDYPRLKF